KPLRNAMPPRRILEVGPGTGAVTAEIVRCLSGDDQLDIVEVNAEFAAIIERRFAQEASFRRGQKITRIIHAPLQVVPGEAVYDFMISGVPLNNFSLPVVKEIFGSYRRLLKPEGILSYFEYLAIRDLKMPFVPAGERERLMSLEKYLSNKIHAFQVAED